MSHCVRALTRLVAVTCVLLGGGRLALAAPSDIAPEVVADFLHAVIEADRTFYTIHVVERLQKQGQVQAAEGWRADKTSLPLPAQFLQEANDLASMTGTRVRYRLISLWPINPLHGPRDEHEKAGLEKLVSNPEQPVTSTITLGGKDYFQAMYADRAVTQACVGCHNAHPRSPKNDFTIDSVMGGLLIEFPLSTR